MPEARGGWLGSEVFLSGDVGEVDDVMLSLRVLMRRSIGVLAT